MDRLGDELLAGPRLAADEDGRVGARDLHHLFAHLPHRAARPEDVREVVALAQLVAQPHVLVHQALPVRFDERLHLERLRQHRTDDAVELRRPVVVAVASESQFDLEHAPALPRLLHRHADVGQVVVFESAAPRAVTETLGVAPRGVRARDVRRERRLLADTWDDQRPAALEDLLGQRAAERRVGMRGTDADGGVEMKAAAVLARQRDDAAAGAVIPLEDLEDAMERRFEVGGAGEGLAHVEQRRQLADLAALPPRPVVEIGRRGLHPGPLGRRSGIEDGRHGCCLSLRK